VSSSQIINSHGEYGSDPISRKFQGIAAPIVAGLVVLLVGLVSGFLLQHSYVHETQPNVSDVTATGTVRGTLAAVRFQARDTAAPPVNESKSGIERLDDQTKMLIAFCVVVISGTGLALSTRKSRR
jgi:hypothetical protein